MKKNLTINKLQLNKTTISALNNAEINVVKGGIFTLIRCPLTDYKCVDMNSRPGIKTYAGCFISEYRICND